MIKQLVKKFFNKLFNLLTTIKLHHDMKEVIKNVPRLVSLMRQKDKIKVLFILPCLSKWKTETLYRAMVKHPRFDPIIGLALMTLDYPSEAVRKYYQLTEYIKNKKYKYSEICNCGDLKTINPDIIFLQEASGGGINKTLSFNYYKNCLYCYIPYGYNWTNERLLINTPYHNICWKFFCESPLFLGYAKTVMDNKGKNIVFTGLPMTDEFLLKQNLFKNTWNGNNTKKRIIWAPHHSIGQKDILQMGTFLSYAEKMCTLAQKYSDSTQWVFKPHPVLRGKLNLLWGKSKTDEYYKWWEEAANTQVADGEYVDFFKYSDALIHDCGSFMVEYLYMNKPCMFLDNGKKHKLNLLGQKCYEKHYLGHTAEDIEQFIINTINGIDPIKPYRESFIQKYLLPPNGKTSCENIICEILNEKLQ